MPLPLSHGHGVGHKVDPNLCKKPSVDLRSDLRIADKTIDCLGLGILPEVDPTVRICDGCAERVDAQHAFRTRDLHNNSYVENGLEDKEDEDVCRFCLKADGGAALVELFPGGGGSVADEVQTVRDCLGVEINSWDKLTKICGDCMGGVEELAEFSPTAVPVKLEDVTDRRIRTALAVRMGTEVRVLSRTVRRRITGRSVGKSGRSRHGRCRGLEVSTRLRRLQV
ncbi:uncharacterized protein LOC119766259 [Culex quinquefasciatus]|uniref:uncharacterized protein LOC119766259 n=1 Tax=Culex quinquefasciatus TaxID=7176 RepID=UPI0018E326C8|nr:uncharacterized protein LOC119766259 [Culex quinquefasciatus]